MRWCAAIVLLAAATASCSYFGRKDAPAPPPVIRYMNLKAVYDFVLNRNRDALDVKKKADVAAARIREIERELDDPGRDHIALLDEYRRLRGDLYALKKQSRGHKIRILSLIDRAVKNVAQKKKLDFIHNIGDELLYAKKEFDVSEEIIREIVRLEGRNTPESR